MPDNDGYEKYARPIAIPEALMSKIMGRWDDVVKKFRTPDPIKVDETYTIYFGSYAAVFRLKDTPKYCVRVEPNTGQWKNEVIKIPDTFQRFFIVPDNYSDEQTYSNGVGYRTQRMEYGGVDVVEMRELVPDFVRLRTGLFQFLSDFIHECKTTNYKVLSFDIKLDNIVCR